MSDLIQSITGSGFPFPQTLRRENKPAEKKRDKSEFERWLANKPVNGNDIDAPFLLVLSLEDELMLAKLREIARPFPPANAYAGAAAPGVPMDEDGQYALPFMVSHDEHI